MMYMTGSWVYGRRLRGSDIDFVIPATAAQEVYNTITTYAPDSTVPCMYSNGVKFIFNTPPPTRLDGCVLQGGAPLPTQTGAVLCPPRTMINIITLSVVQFVSWYWATQFMRTIPEVVDKNRRAYTFAGVEISIRPQASYCVESCKDLLDWYATQPQQRFAEAEEALSDLLDHVRKEPHFEFPTTSNSHQSNR